MAKQRLQKVLAAAGIGSRRKCEQLILSGTVEVNKRIVNELPVFIDPQEDIITVNGKKIPVDSARRTKKVYFLLNKPKGVICTSSDPFGRKKAVDFIPADERIFCVGRLDADTTGVIILTNDSELANKLTHPRYEVPKTYIARVKGQVSGEAVEKLKKGIWLSEGKTSRASVRVLKRDYKESLIEIIIRQGLNRQVRRMLAKVGLPVKSLKRTRIGNITAQGLGIGKFRTLTKAEIAYLSGYGSALPASAKRFAETSRRDEKKI
jgi:23S rRNA pseudouridine2605 synthase